MLFKYNKKIVLNVIFALKNILEIRLNSSEETELWFES